ncbi:hypothetical protein RB599_001285 [Gaeumannomyces hyphopodioides]
MRHGVCFLPEIQNKINFGSPYLPLLLDSGVDEGGFDYHASSVVALATTLVQLQDDDVIKELNIIFKDLISDGGMTPTTKYCALLDLLETDAFANNVDCECQTAIKACLSGEFANSIGVEEEAVTESLFHTTVVKPLAVYHHRMQKFAVQGGSAQKHSGTAGQEDDHHKRGPLLPPDEAVQAFQTPSHQAVHLAGNDEADDAPRREIFRTQDGAFQTGRHATPANWLGDLKKISGDIMKIPGQCELRPRAIRVAILDTGVNLGRQFFKSRVRREKIRKLADFAPGGRPGEDAVDTFGHGSLMAQLLMEVAPMADVYIARVAADTDSLSRSKAAIAQAIEWADNQDVDIISMSFGFDENDPSISGAIESVYTRRGGSVIFIASAGNSLYEHEKFPAQHPFVIAIYATDTRGTFVNTNSPLTGDSGPVFGTYAGDQIPSRFTEEYGSTICKPGSSVATAIAAAIATITLAYIESLPWVGLAVADKVKMDQELKRRREKLLNLQKLRTRVGMSGVFNRMAPDKTQQRRWICPIWFWHDRPQNEERQTALLEVANDVRIPAPVRRSV